MDDETTVVSFFASRSEHAFADASDQGAGMRVVAAVSWSFEVRIAVACVANKAMPLRAVFHTAVSFPRDVCVCTPHAGVHGAFLVVQTQSLTNCTHSFRSIDPLSRLHVRQSPWAFNGSMGPCSEKLSG